MWEVDNKEGLVSKNWCFQTAVMKETLEGPLNSKIQPVNPKGNQLWILIGKDPDVGKDWRQEEKGMTEDMMVVWHHWINGHEFEQAPENSEGQGSLACCSPWGQKELDMT